jgi:tetratricopeptide (TPR) repeat protein
VVRLNWVVFNLCLAMSVPAAAERMPVDTHNILIAKLERALSELPNSATERRPIAVRLADLYADRARLLLLAKQDEGCGQCPDGSADRARAVELYGQVVNELNTDAQGPVLLQMGHLQTALGRTDAAITTFQRATQSRYAALIGARANASLGEIKFRQAQFAAAEKKFKAALANEEIPNPGFLTYRLAWSQLNQGKSLQATKTLIHLLETPELLTVQNQDGLTFDESFHDDVTRDLVVFLARGNVAEAEIDLLLSLTPDKMRRENLYAFANELERLGKKYSATLAWRRYIDEGDNNPFEALEMQIRVAQLNWDMGEKQQALEEYDRAAQMWKDKGCKAPKGPVSPGSSSGSSANKCDELGKRFKNFVTTWHKVEKDKPSESCLKAYMSYLKAFGKDPEMHYKAATVADLNKKHKEAAELYARAVVLLSAAARDKKSVQKDLLEAALLKQIEAAELSNDKKAQIKAYDAFLELSGNSNKAVEVRYQKAQTYYEMGQHQEAFNQFLDIATENAKEQRALRVKAADLALDALATMKKDEALFEWAPKLAVIYPERGNEFGKIQRQAAIQLATAALDKKDISNSTLRREMERLRVAQRKGGPAKDQIVIAKNLIAISLRLKDLDAIAQSSNSLLEIKGISGDDRELALGNLAWVAELKMEFAKALRLSKQMQLNNLSPDDRQLRLAVLADLAGQDPRPYYERALKATGSNKKALGIRATLVRRSSKPWFELEKQAARLVRDPQLVSALLTETYERDGNDAKAKSFIRRYNLKKSTLARIIARHDLILEWQKWDRVLTRHQLYYRSDALMQRSIIERISKLNKQDYLGREALKLRDWSTQLLVISTVARENQRMYQDLLKLPVPRSVKAADREKYLALVRSRAEPFRQRAEAASSKLKEFWKNDAAVNELSTAIANSRGRVREFLRQEGAILAALAPSAVNRRLVAAMRTTPERPSVQDVARVKSRLAKDPFDTGVAQELKLLAEKRGEVTMVAFLDARIQQLKKGARQ